MIYFWRDSFSLSRRHTNQFFSTLLVHTKHQSFVFGQLPLLSSQTKTLSTSIGWHFHLFHTRTEGYRVIPLIHSFICFAKKNLSIAHHWLVADYLVWWSYRRIKFRCIRNCIRFMFTSSIPFVISVGELQLGWRRIGGWKWMHKTDSKVQNCNFEDWLQQCLVAFHV